MSDELESITGYVIVCKSEWGGDSVLTPREGAPLYSTEKAAFNAKLSRGYGDSTVHEAVLTIGQPVRM